MLDRDNKAARPREEIEGTIRAFTAADWSRIHSVALSFMYGTGWDPDDLSQEAILRTLQGKRNCPTDVDLMKHLIDTMSSIADGERKKPRSSIVHLPTMQPDIEDAVDPASPDWNAEEKHFYQAQRSEILAIFDDDQTARDLVEGLLEGFDTDQLKELTGLDGTGYASKRTLIRRRLVKLRPKGVIA
ncbi:hypothetical protein [Tardiphaga sp.]|uniref:hypothetical protein n=1 Tax=Tardiphaga sp. TaxID=1926292 RepID=UPI00261242B0|nr:hypothetical protein [Tardiphaga sp.]MDB5620420.1 DNA-directed polymerase specialized sigma subunit, sigma24 [Tardiphaga sp.]